MFLHLSVILITGGGFAPGGLCLGGSLSGGVSIQVGSPSGGGVSVREAPIR